MQKLPDASLAWEDLSAVDRRPLTEMLVDKIIIERHPSKIDKDGSATTPSAPSVRDRTWRPRVSRQCTRRGSRSSRESEQLSSGDRDGSLARG